MLAVPLDWIDLAVLPGPQEGTEMNDAVRGVLFQALVAAWIGLSALGVEAAFVSFGIASPSDLTDDLVQAILEAAYHNEIASTSRCLHPLQLAISLSRTTTTPLLLFLYRQLTAATILPSSPFSVQIRLIALIAFSLTISTCTRPDVGTSSKHTPAQLWDLTRRTCSSLVNQGEDPGRLRGSADTISALVHWCEDMLAQRKEDRMGWFEGKEWMALMEMAIGLGQRVRRFAI